MTEAFFKCESIWPNKITEFSEWQNYNNYRFTFAHSLCCASITPSFNSPTDLENYRSYIFIILAVLHFLPHSLVYRKCDLRHNNWYGRGREGDSIKSFVAHISVWVNFIMNRNLIFCWVKNSHWIMRHLVCVYLTMRNFARDKTSKGNRSHM